MKKKGELNHKNKKRTGPLERSRVMHFKFLQENKKREKKRGKKRKKRKKKSCPFKRGLPFMGLCSF